MKAEFTLPDEVLDLIADKVVEKLKPRISVNGRDESADTILDKKGLSEYLKVSVSTINKMVSNRQIPHIKIQLGQSGAVRFRQRDINNWIRRQSIPETTPFGGKLK